MTMQIITPSTHDIGAFDVRRTLPDKARTMVGPFIFVHQFGPAHFDVGPGMDVRPHQIGRASCRERVCQYDEISVVAVSLKQKQTQQLQTNALHLNKHTPTSPNLSRTVYLSHYKQSINI